jgi:hypothetical protein
MTPKAARKPINIDVSVLLIGFSADAAHSRFGLTLQKPEDFKETAKRHAALIADRKCRVEGCKRPIAAQQPHGWTCADHDAVELARIEAKRNKQLVKTRQPIVEEKRNVHLSEKRSAE